MMKSKNDIEKNWKTRGYSCDLWIDPPGQLWKDYVHKTDELLMLIKGRLRIKINGQSQEIEPREEIFIPAHTKHTVENIGATTAWWLYGYKK